MLAHGRPNHQLQPRAPGGILSVSRPTFGRCADMFRTTVFALCCLAVMQDARDAVVRFGEARLLLESDWAGIREALGASRMPWLINVSHASQMSFVWHASVYLPASMVRDDLRRGPLADLEATYEGRRRVWRDLRLNGAWAQVAVSSLGLPDDVVESEMARPFVVRGEFTDAELRAIVTALRVWRAPAGEQPSAAFGPLAALGRRSATTAEAELAHHVFAALELRNGEWVIASTRMAIP